MGTVEVGELASEVVVPQLGVVASAAAAASVLTSVSDVSPLTKH